MTNQDTPPSTHYQLIDNSQALEAACQQAAKHNLLALDTEFIRRDTYYPILALIQITWPDNETPCLIDPLAIKDLSPLLELLATPHIIKVLHAGSEDLEIFYHLIGTHITPVFDTQLANTCIGGQSQVGYANLVKSLFDTDLNSEQTCSNWQHRPLTADQCAYAALDVCYLLPMYHHFKQLIDQAQRNHWLVEEQGYLQQRITDGLSAELTYMKVRQHWRLPPDKLNTLKTLCIWREQTAQQENRPRKRVLDDEALFDLAQLNSATSNQLAKLKSLSPRKIKRYQDEWSTLIEPPQKTGESEKTRLPVKSPLAKQHQELLKPIKKLIQDKATQLGIQPEFLMGKRFINDLLRVTITHPDTSINDWPKHLTGWRHQTIVQPIQAWLEENHASLR